MHTISRKINISFNSYIPVPKQKQFTYFYGRKKLYAFTYAYHHIRTEIYPKTILKINIIRCLIMEVRVIPQGTVDNILGPYGLAGPKALEPNSLIARPLSGSPNCAW